MSVYIRLIRNNIKSSSSYGKYFAKAVSQGEVTLDEIAAEACRNSGFSEGSVIGVATEIQDIMKQPRGQVLRCSVDVQHLRGCTAFTGMYSIYVDVTAFTWMYSIYRDVTACKVSNSPSKIRGGRGALTTVKN